MAWQASGTDQLEVIKVLQKNTRTTEELSAAQADPVTRDENRLAENM